MADKKVEVEFELKDEYTAKAEKIEESNKKIEKSFERVGESTLEANVKFMTTIESIDRFGTSIQQLRGGLEDTGLVSEEQAKQLQKITGVADILVSTTNILIISQKALKSITMENIKTLGTLGAVAGSLAFAYMAVTSKSKEEKEIFSALTGITTALATAQFALSLAKMAGWGPLAPIIITAVVGSMAAAMTYFMSMAHASAQTNEDEYRIIEKTGIILAHEGEVIGRVSAPKKAPQENKNINIYINAVLNDSPDNIARKIADYMRWSI